MSKGKRSPASPLHPLLLDTHVWIWTVEGDEERLSGDLIQRIEEAAQVGAVLVHAVSVWEAGTLVRKGRLSLSMPVERWVDRALGLPGTFVLDLTPASALEAALLSSEVLPDPADRMLVSAARMENAVLLTADRRILDLAEGGGFRAMSPR